MVELLLELVDKGRSLILFMRSVCAFCIDVSLLEIVLNNFVISIALVTPTLLARSTAVSSPVAALYLNNFLPPACECLGILKVLGSIGCFGEGDKDSECETFFVSLDSFESNSSS